MRPIAFALLICLAAGAAHATPVVSVKVISGAASRELDGTIDAPPSLSNFTVGGYTISTVGVGTGGDVGFLSYTIQVQKATNLSPLIVIMSENDLAAEIGTQYDYATTNSITMKSKSTVTTASYVDASNTLFGTATQISGGSVTGTSNTLNNYVIGPHSGNFIISSPFSMTKVFTFTPVSTTVSPSVNGQYELDFVPEPSSITVLASALAGFGLISRRRNPGSKTPR